MSDVSEKVVRAIENPSSEDRRPIHVRENFDDRFYLQRHPDIARAVRDGHFRDGWHHYDIAGRDERRVVRLVDFDVPFYVSSYSQVAEDIAAGRAANPRQHYERLGKARGYLPHLTAERPSHPTAMPSPFGGLWPDQPDAYDVINGKLEIGQITELQADLLRFWTRNGYVVLENAIPPDIIDAARQALEDAYSGKLEGQLFECPAHTHNRNMIKWAAEINDLPAKALDVHYRSAAVRDAIFSDAISDFLGLVFQSRALASQSLGFWRGSAQEIHQDTAYVGYTLPRSFAASWIALEDVTLGAGELVYFDGSHKLPDFLYGGFSKTVYDARRQNGSVADTDFKEFVSGLRKGVATHGMAERVFAAKKGDVLIWHADLVHGGKPVSRDVTRKSVVTHYCPSHLTPLYAENRAISIHPHGKHRFMTSIYGTQLPGM